MLLFNFLLHQLHYFLLITALDGSPALGPISPEAGKYLGKQNQQPSQPAQKFERLQEKPVIKQQSVTENSKRYDFTTQSTVRPACAGCGIITTAKPIPGQPFPFQNPAFKEPASPPQGPIAVDNRQNITPAQPASPSVLQGQQAPNPPFAPAGNPQQPSSDTLEKLNGNNYGSIDNLQTGPGVVPNINSISSSSPHVILPNNQGIPNYPNQQLPIPHIQQNPAIGPVSLPPDVELLPPGAAVPGTIPGTQSIIKYPGPQQNGPIQTIPGPDLGKTIY